MAGAPDITLETQQSLSVMEFKEQLADVITEADQKLLYYFFLHTTEMLVLPKFVQLLPCILGDVSLWEV